MSTEMNLEEQLVASTAIANWQRAGKMPPTNRVATVDLAPPSASAFMPVMDIDHAVKRWEAINMFIGRIMTPEVDFGVIPGSRKPSLLKSGAEKLVAFFGLAPKFDVVQRTEQWDKDGMFAYEIKCRLIRDGQVRGEGLGSCNSRETNYRNRPAADLANTILKMAKKRALVDAVLNTTGASQFFTQDVEDMREHEPARGSREAQQAVAARKISDLKALEEQARKPVEWPVPEKAWTTRGQMREIFSRLREAVGEVEFSKEMERAGVQAPADFHYLNDARASYTRLVAIAQQEVA